ncbi:MAG: hypothetical protein ACREVD_06780 [Burkholderiales bacterium]
MRRMRMGMLAAAIAGCFAASAGLAAETPFEMKGCLANESSVVDTVGDITVGTNVTRGTMDFVGALTDKMTHDCRVLWVASKAGLEFTNRCVNVDKDGDKHVTMATGMPKSFQWKFLAGSGKYAGIGGGGTGEINSPYPRGRNFGASCWQGRGTYTLAR